MRSTKHWHPNSLLLIAVTLLSLALFTPPGHAQFFDARPQTGLAEEPLVIETETGQRHEFTVEMAITPREQAVGMMFRRKAPRDRGMLFPFEEPKIASFWMKNTIVPLDLIFIAADGTITDIHARAIPLSEDPLSSTVEVVAVLELAGGETDRRDIRVGDKVLHGFFAP